MRGTDTFTASLFTMRELEDFVPLRHPLREIRETANAALEKLGPMFTAMYAAEVKGGRPSIAPEKLLRAMLLQVLYSVRSKRQLMEQVQYNLLFRWFIGLSMDDAVWVPTVFSKNRERLIEHDAVILFFNEVVAIAHQRGLLSGEHFSVDGTLIEAWAGHKSFVAKGDGQNGDGGCTAEDFRGQRRSNDTHESKTDPQARLIRKGRGKEAKLAYMGHALIENRNGLVVDFDVTPATGTAEREAAVRMIERQRRQRGAGKPRRITVAADKAYDSKAFVQACRAARATPHVAQFVTSRRRSNVDGRTTRHPGYAMSTRARRLIEKVFGWMKGFGGIRRTRFRGLDRTSLTTKFVAAAYNILRIANLTTA